MRTKWTRLLTGTVAVFSLTLNSDAAFNTSLIYGEVAAEMRADAAFNRYQAEANHTYSALISSSPEAANAGYYQNIRESYIEFYQGSGLSLWNYYNNLAWSDIGNLAKHVIDAYNARSSYNSVAVAYSDSYAPYTNPFYWGGNYGDWVDLQGYLASTVYDVESDIVDQVHPAFSGSYYQYALIYRAVGDGIQAVYYAYGNYTYASYAAAGDLSGADTMSAPYFSQGFTQWAIYDQYSLYYLNLAISEE